MIWHFVNHAYLDDGGEISDYPEFEFSRHNISEVIPDLISWMKEEDGFQFTYTYKEVMKHLAPQFT